MATVASDKALISSENEMKTKLAKFQTEIDAALKEENKVLTEKMDNNDQKLKKYDEAIASHRAKIDNWKTEMNNIKLHGTDGNPAPELEQQLTTELNDICIDTFLSSITRTKAELEKMSPNLQAIADYRNKEEVYLSQVAELDDVTRQRDEQRKNVEMLRESRLKEFMAGFAIITTELKELYKRITLEANPELELIDSLDPFGERGDAELELVDSLDPFTEGIVFSIRPPKKTCWMNISELSGGEKTLSSLALVFALHYYKPTPFYVMDEIDTAHDLTNVSIVGNYIRHERARNAQFIVFSIRSIPVLKPLSSEEFQTARLMVRNFNHGNIYLAPAVLQHLVSKGVVDIDGGIYTDMFGPHVGQAPYWMLRAIIEAQLAPQTLCQIAAEANHVVMHNGLSEIFYNYKDFRQSWLDLALHIDRLDVYNRLVKIVVEEY